VALAVLISLGNFGMVLGTLLDCLLYLAVPVAGIGVALLLFAGFSIVLGRLQWAIWSRRASGRTRVNDGFGPYR